MTDPFDLLSGAAGHAGGPLPEKVPSASPLLGGTDPGTAAEPDSDLLDIVGSSSEADFDASFGGGAHYGLPDVLKNQKFLNFAKAEQKAHRSLGRSLTVEEILSNNGFLPKTEKKNKGDGLQDLSMQDLRLHVLPSEQRAMGIVLLRLTEGVLYIASSGRLSEADKSSILDVFERSRVMVRDLAIDLVDRSEMARLLRAQEEVPAERLPKLFARLADDPDDVTLIEQAVKDLLSEALQSRASDIHMTSLDSDVKCWIRYRIDGDLVMKHLLPARVMAPIFTRLKTYSRMDAGERNRPQDGRLEFAWQGRTIDIRVAVKPTHPGGEKLTARLLDSAHLRSFDELFPKTSKISFLIRRATHSPIKDGGLIILSGPTGSGKSSTLYSIIMDIDRLSKSVYTAEAPVEYEMENVDQTSISDGSNLKMADIVRALLRHDPNIIAIGELRDYETTEAALRAAESGHLVLTTIHADTSIASLERFQNLLRLDDKATGMSVLGQTLKGVLSQRLVRLVCPFCSHKLSAIEALHQPTFCHAIGLTENSQVSLANPEGCDVCGHTGFYGRDLALDALFLPDGQNARREITDRLVAQKATSILEVPGVFHMPRARSLRDMITAGKLDVRIGLNLLREESSTRSVPR